MPVVKHNMKYQMCAIHYRPSKQFKLHAHYHMTWDHKQMRRINCQIQISNFMHNIYIAFCLAK